MVRAIGAAILVAHAQATCIDDVANIVKTGGVLGQDIIKTVRDCHKGDETSCAADASTVTDAAGELEKTLALTAEDCGHTGQGCTAAVQKVGDDIEALKDGVKDIVDDCTGKGHSEIKCVEAVLTLSPKGVQIAADITGAVHACHKKNETNIEDNTEKPLCSLWGITGCAVAAGAAAAACGGPIDPADSACILAALAAIPGCGPCLCSTVHCPGWCPCNDEGIAALLAQNSSGTVVV